MVGAEIQYADHHSPSRVNLLQTSAMLNYRLIYISCKQSDSDDKLKLKSQSVTYWKVIRATFGFSSIAS